MSWPGNELKKLLSQVNIRANENCRCGELAHQMNLWGVEGCKRHRSEIVAELRTAAKQRGLAIEVVAQLTSGWFVDESIRRAEQKTTRPA